MPESKRTPYVPDSDAKEKQHEATVNDKTHQNQITSVRTPRLAGATTNLTDLQTGPRNRAKGGGGKSSLHGGEVGARDVMSAPDGQQSAKKRGNGENASDGRQQNTVKNLNRPWLHISRA